jgi:hypothetical protein
MWLQQLPHWVHSQAMVAPSLNRWFVVHWHAQYLVVLAARIRYLPEIRVQK